MPATPEDKTRMRQLASGLGQLCDGFPTATVGAAVAHVCGQWLASYPRSRWPEVFGSYLETVLQIAEVEQEQRRDSHGKAKADCN